jgi:hypothetical protein
VLRKGKSVPAPLVGLPILVSSHSSVIIYACMLIVVLALCFYQPMHYTFNCQECVGKRNILVTQYPLQETVVFTTSMIHGFLLCLVYPRLPVSLNYLVLISHSVLSNVYYLCLCIILLIVRNVLGREIYL